jgi:Protein of unknown function with HXXEE motif
MHFMRLHWFDVGLALAAVVGAVLLIIPLDRLSLILWLQLIALFIHQAEEYRYPGYFPGMLNTTLYMSTKPDRYPLNTNTALLVNVGVGWLVYVLAAVLGEMALWLAIATMLVSAGNLVAHTVLFNLKGRTLYNPGMLTALLLFLPIVVSFGWLVIQGQLASALDWVLGLVLGAALNYVGVLKLIDWLKDEHTTYIFPQRFLRASE